MGVNSLTPSTLQACTLLSSLPVSCNTSLLQSCSSSSMSQRVSLLSSRPLRPALFRDAAERSLHLHCNTPHHVISTPPPSSAAWGSLPWLYETRALWITGTFSQFAVGLPFTKPFLGMTSTAALAASLGMACMKLYLCACSCGVLCQAGGCLCTEGVLSLHVIPFLLMSSGEFLPASALQAEPQ